MDILFFVLKLLVIAGFHKVEISAYGSFWQLTDIHLDPWYHSHQLSCNRHLSETGKYGSFECDAPMSLTESSIHAMKDITPNVDFIIWTGDNAPHAAPDMYDEFISTDVIIDITRNLTGIIKAAFPGKLVIPVLGNWDYYPTNQLPGNGSVTYDQYAEIWRSWLDTPDMQQTFRLGGYYTRMVNVEKKVRVVALNSNLYLGNNKFTQGVADPGGQFAWFTSVMEAARTSAEKVYVLTHVPIGMTPDAALGTGSPNFPEQHNTRQVELFIEYSDITLGIFSAHAHHDTYKLFYKNGVAVSAMFVPPSVSPIRYLVNKEEDIGIAHNPAIRLVTFDEQTYEPIDIHQYSMDLVQANEVGVAEWKLLYSFADAYGLEDVSITQLHQALQKFKVIGSEEFESFFEYFMVKTDHYANPKTCDCGCKTTFLCSIEYPLYADFNTCYEKKDACVTPTNTATRLRSYFVIYALLPLMHIMTFLNL